jgi:hypothetical protein
LLIVTRFIASENALTEYDIQTAGSSRKLVMKSVGTDPCQCSSSSHNPVLELISILFTCASTCKIRETTMFVYNFSIIDKDKKHIQIHNIEFGGTR